MEKRIIEEIIDSFANEGRIFENEAQFQFAYAWRLKEHLGENASILLEHRLNKEKNSPI